MYAELPQFFPLTTRRAAFNGWLRHFPPDHLERSLGGKVSVLSSKNGAFLLVKKLALPLQTKPTIAVMLFTHVLEFTGEH
jgi:hypothetical protein